METSATHDKGGIFIDAQEMARLYPDTFNAPSTEDISEIKNGDHVKVCNGQERFWILVSNNDIVTQRITGQVDNILFDATEGLGLGDPVTVEYRHVYNLLIQKQPASTVTAILIDVKAQEVKEVQIRINEEDAYIDSIALLGEGTHLREAVLRYGDDVLWTDEEGLFHEKSGCFRYDGLDVTLQGNGLITGKLDENDLQASVELSIEEVRESVTFLPWKKPTLAVETLRNHVLSGTAEWVAEQKRKLLGR